MIQFVAYQGETKLLGIAFALYSCNIFFLCFVFIFTRKDMLKRCGNDFLNLLDYRRLSF